MMDQRRALAHAVLAEGLSLSAAGRRFGVSRQTARTWANRAREQGIDAMGERSRRPLSVPGRTEAAVELALLGLKERYPAWGAKKLCVLLEREGGPRLAVRTADRILRRHGLVTPRDKPAPPQRFERERAMDLLQADFKGMPRPVPYSPLTVLDDAGRFCLAFEPLRDRTGERVFSFLWELFFEHGLPLEMLMDNGDCWGSRSRYPTAFEAKLMLLGIRPTHGRPRHPQTQGKVERFHQTAKLELGEALAQPSIELARAAYRLFVDRYNWVRPHEALAGKTPGSLYGPSRRKRPERMPEHQIPEGAISRKVDEQGFISYRGQPLKVGKGLIGQRLVLRPDERGVRPYFAGFALPYLGGA